eukprot:1391127-Prymnesium_polylepis.1
MAGEDSERMRTERAMSKWNLVARDRNGVQRELWRLMNRDRVHVVDLFDRLDRDGNQRLRKHEFLVAMKLFVNDESAWRSDHGKDMRDVTDEIWEHLPKAAEGGVTTEVFQAWISEGQSAEIAAQQRAARVRASRASAGLRTLQRRESSMALLAAREHEKKTGQWRMRRVQAVQERMQAEAALVAAALMLERGTTTHAPMPVRTPATHAVERRAAAESVEKRHERAADSHVQRQRAATDKRPQRPPVDMPSKRAPPRLPTSETAKIRGALGSSCSRSTTAPASLLAARIMINPKLLQPVRSAPRLSQAPRQSSASAPSSPSDRMLVAYSYLSPSQCASSCAVQRLHGSVQHRPAPTVPRSSLSCAEGPTSKQHVRRAWSPVPQPPLSSPPKSPSTPMEHRPQRMMWCNYTEASSA